MSLDNCECARPNDASADSDIEAGAARSHFMDCLQQKHTSGRHSNWSMLQVSSTDSIAEENILKSPIIQSAVSPATRAAVCIETFCLQADGALVTVGFGTGFLHRRLGKWFVITNWHVATARDPENPGALLEGYKSSPNAYSLHLAVKADPNRFVPTVPFALYQNGAPNWLETTINGVNGRVDLVALPVELPVGADAPLVVPIEEFSPEPRDFLFAGREVVVVGYPFGIGAANPHAIWKRAFVASEPSMLIAGMPKYYIDGPGRPGMSGSPVFILSRGMQVTADTHALLTNVESGGALAALAQISSAELLSAPDALIPRFAGVYSGSVGNQSLDQLRVGIAWHASLVDRLFTHPVPGSNPNPPFIM